MGRPKLTDAQAKSSPSDRARAAKSYATHTAERRAAMTERKRQNSRYRVHLARRKDTQLAESIKNRTLTIVKAGQIANPTFVLIYHGRRRQKEKLTSRCTDKIAADHTPIPHRSKRDTAILEAVAKMYGENATYEQIADRILHDFDTSEGTPE